MIELLPSAGSWRSNGDVQSPSELPQYIVVERQDGRARPVVAHAVTVGLVCIIYALSDDPSLVLILGGALMFVTYLALGLGEARKTPLLLGPLSFYFFWYSIGLGVAALYIGIQVSSGDPIPFATPSTSVVPQDAATAYVIFLVGSVALHAGMQRFRPIGVHDNAADRPDLRAAITPLEVMYVVGLVALVHPSLLAPLGGSLSGPFMYAALAALSCFALASPAELGVTRAAFRAMLVIGTACLFVAETNSSSKAFTMYSLVPLSWHFFRDRALRRWLPLLAVASVLVYSIVYQVQNVARMHTERYYSKSTSYLTITREALKEWLSGEVVPEHTSATQQVDQFLRRQFDPLPVGFIVEQVRESGLRMGETMAYASYSFIPRIIWPDKPEVPRGSWFTSYLGFSAPYEHPVYVGQTATGELYWNFGLLGVLGGMFLIGALLGGLWRMAGADPHRQPLRMLLYLLIMLNMPNMPEAVTVVASIVATFLVFGTAFWVLKVRGK